ncbi:MAG: sigma-70 family RNA polymerase sigma factor [Actinomycetota bacterium]
MSAPSVSPPSPELASDVADHDVSQLQRRESLIRTTMPLARSLALRYRDRGEILDDLIQVAYLGLVKAARHYREDAGANFEAFAVPTITGELRRHFRDRGWDIRPPRRLQELRINIRHTEETLGHRLSRTPHTAEIAEYLGVTELEVSEALSASQGYSTISLDTPPIGIADTGQTDADSALALMTGAHHSAAHDALYEDPHEGLMTSEAVRPLLAKLDARDQRILALRYYGGYTQQEIAERVGVTQMQVSRLLAQALQRIREHMDRS